MSKNILIGISGGIAAYKTANLVSKLKKNGYNVDVIMTKNATEIITPLTLETLSKNKVVVDMFEKRTEYDVRHISLAEKADMLLVVPATYNIIGKVASGIADDMLTTVISACKAKKVFALAMNTNMYENPILWKNISYLKSLSYEFIDAGEGMLACDVLGKGRMEEPEKIYSYIEDYFEKKRVLKGKKVLITAGPTEERIDPIRYISNRSSGKMGYALAKAAKILGAEVTLISGPVNLEKIELIKTIDVRTAIEMQEEINKEYKDKDIVIMAAAVADYRVKEYSEQKIKKTNGDFFIQMERNPDILKGLGDKKENQFLLGFAAESENLRENAIGKLESKNLDMIVANSVSAFQSEKNSILIIDKDKNVKEIESGLKEDLAYSILDAIVKKL